MMSLWDALRMNMMISYQELVRTFLNGVLGLNSSSTATGLGIQLKYNDSPVQFGKLIKYGTTTSAGEIVNIPFKAAYYMTSANARSGSVSATASFTMTYR
ncbi:fimbrial protein [Enterobacter roggenkampii]|uniref:fimbrial protein n=1 Tax=Enterobacter roggenkampii TaxID=1812935 RepID=UPI00216701E6|nr:fimbrial protein [Enterobacter roggenkampii]